ncbi:hypothetical protein LV779_27090 [Streptomyces thinghirensis]|nr:hypothetical protein [Streptomyces thinghirensis]
MALVAGRGLRDLSDLGRRCLHPGRRGGAVAAAAAARHAVRGGRPTTCCRRGWARARSTCGSWRCGLPLARSSAALASICWRRAWAASPCWAPC